MGTTTFNGVLRSGAGGSNSKMLKGTPVLSYETPTLTAADLPYAVYFPNRIFLSSITVVTSGAGALPATGTVESNFVDDKDGSAHKALAVTDVTAAGITNITGDPVYTDDGKSMCMLTEGTAVDVAGFFHMRFNYYQLDPKDGAA